MDEFWYCLNHHQVEPADGCAASQRLGPYPTQEEAARALEKVKERNDAWDNDPLWNDTELEDWAGPGQVLGPFVAAYCMI